MLWSREDYIAHMTGEFTGKEMLTELFGLLVGLDKEWIQQGASEAELNLSAFGFDNVKNMVLPVNCGLENNREEVVVSDNSTETVTIDKYGRKVKLIKASASIPLPLEYPVKTQDDWLKIKPDYLFKEERVDKEKLLNARRLWDEGTLSVGFVPGGFDEPRQLMGEEELCIAFYEEPELVEDILETIADTTLKVYERVWDILPVDLVSIHEDLAGKPGPLIGPNIVTEFMKPYYRKIWDEMERQGCKIFSQDSDGNINPVIDAFIDCGVNTMFPFEPMADMDIVEIRKKYPNLSIKGGIDKHALRKDKSAILKELEYKLTGPTRGGRVCFGLDHRIPNGITVENYWYYVKTAKEILGIPEHGPNDFIRMAF